MILPLEILNFPSKSLAFLGKILPLSFEFMAALMYILIACSPDLLFGLFASLFREFLLSLLKEGSSFRKAFLVGSSLLPKEL